MPVLRASVASRSHSIARRIAVAGVAAVAVLGVAGPVAHATDQRPPSQPAATSSSATRTPAGTGFPTNTQPVAPPIVPGPPGPLLTPPASPPPVSEPAAIAEARASGNPVEVTEDTTETSLVNANPNGTFTLRSSLLPTRVHRNGAWIPVDPTLHSNPDGTLSPAASTENMAFSGGGTGPLVTLTQDSRALAFSWPGALPAPRVSGATATYPSVLPGVDLLLTARAADFGEILVVHDATAAANPALAHITMTATASGLTVSADTSGILSATDPSGRAVFHGSTPIMWDSAVGSPGDASPTASDPGSGHVSRLALGASPRPTQGAKPLAGGAVVTSATTVDIVPDQAALRGPGVTYPLYIDPSMAHGEEHWTEVTQNGWYYFDPIQLAQVGNCGHWADCNGLTVARSYFQMGTEQLTSSGTTATVFSAAFYATEAHNAAGCATPEPVTVDEAGPINSATRWPGPDGRYLDTKSSSASEGCVANIPALNVTSAAQDAANGHWANLTLLLRAGDETNDYQWKKFQVASGQPWSPELDITYSFPPNSAYGLHVSNAVTCTGTTYTADTNPTLYASATDNNTPPLNLGVKFELSNNNFASDIDRSGFVVIGSGSTAGWRSNTGLGAGAYQFRTTVDNNPGLSTDLSAGVDTYYNFTRLAPTTTVPAISTWDYPQNYWGEPNDSPGSIAFFGNGTPNLAGFTWTLGGAGTEAAPNTATCAYNQTFGSGTGTTGGFIAPDANGNAVLQIPAGLSVGYHVMYVRSFDYAHNESPESQSYVFYVAPPAGVVGGWQDAEKLPYSQPAGQTVPLGPQSNCCGVSWNGGAQLLFQGNAVNQSFSMTVTLPTAAHYELATNLTRAPDYGIMSLSLDGTPLTVNGLSTFDGYSPTVTTAYDTLGGAYLAKGQHTITATMTGTNPSSVGNRYLAGIDGFGIRATNELDAGSVLNIQAADQSGQNITPVVVANGNGVTYRGGTGLLYPATAAGQSMKMTFTAPVEADYALGASLIQRPNYGELQFTLDGTTVLANTSTAPFDGYATAPLGTYLPLGGAHLTVGQHAITVTVVGHNAASSGFQVVLGDLTVAPINNVVAGTFAQAVNNHGIVHDAVNTGASLDPFGNALSAESMTTAGIAPGARLTVSGATFTLPPVGSATTNDNVVADGQTVLLDPGQQVRASAIGLLAASTCTWSPEATATVSYADGTTSNPVVPMVPDWVDGDSTTATVVTAHVDNAVAAPMTAREGHLYAIFLPTGTASPVTSITLPYTGSAQLGNTCNVNGTKASSLHVFAIAPRPLPDGAGGNWLGAWAAPVDAAMTPPGGQSFADQTVRMIVHPTNGGGSVRVRLSNADAPGPATIDHVTIGGQADTAGTGFATLAAPSPLTFGGTAGVVLPAGGEAVSDPVPMPPTSGGSGNLLVSLHLPSPGVTAAPVHSTSGTTAFLTPGDTTATQTPSAPTTVSGDYFLVGLDVTTSADPTAGTVGTIAVLGDQTSTAGAANGACGGGSGYACSWVDDLPTTTGLTIPGTVVNVSRAGSAPQDRWALNDGSGTTAADPYGAKTATATGGVTWSASAPMTSTGSVVFDGSTGSLATAGPVLNTADSFTVSAWVNPRGLGTAFQKFVVQQATVGSSFSLEYDGGTGKWAFSRVESDTMGPVVDRAESTQPAQANTWTHLVGVYNQGDGQIKLYVNGGYASTAPVGNPIASSGPLVIGRGFFGGANGNYTNGSVSDVRVYQRPLTALDVDNLFDLVPPQQAAPGAGAPSAYNLGLVNGNVSPVLPTSPDTQLNQMVLAEPNLRTVIVSLGADDVLNNVSAAVIEQNLTKLMGFASPFGLKNVKGPDGTAVHVFLTTVPPLGIAPQNDAREQIRETLNADILQNYANYGADGVIDFDQAVRDTSPNLIQPALLTNGAPNANYYTNLANAVAAAVQPAFPPRPGL